MSLIIGLDAGPLGLLTHRQDNSEAQACRKWLGSHLAAGTRIVVPAIADYEVRRELLRAGKTAGISRLDDFIHSEPDRYLPPTAQAFQMAAQLWAKVRQEGLTTAADQALDADVILAAQLLTSRWAALDLVVATTNTRHISRFLKASRWQDVVTTP